MMRRTGFGRHEIVRTPQPLYAPVERRGTYEGATGGPAPKPAAARNPHLLDMARGRPCLLRVPDVCNGDRETTVACHSNLGIHGKAGARKADDQYTAWGCSSCHTWLDAGSADGEMKRLTFMLAHLDQVAAWRAIAADPSQPAKDRAAAQWALDKLNATPVGQETPC